MLVPNYETTQRHNPEGNYLHSYCHKSLISCLSLYSDIQYLELVAQWKPLSINTPLILQQYLTVNAVQIPSIFAYDICNWSNKASSKSTWSKGLYHISH